MRHANTCWRCFVLTEVVVLLDWQVHRPWGVTMGRYVQRLLLAMEEVGGRMLSDAEVRARCPGPDGLEYVMSHHQRQAVTAASALQPATVPTATTMLFCPPGRMCTTSQEVAVPTAGHQHAGGPLRRPA